MKKKTEIIIALTATFMFFYITSYASFNAFGELVEGAGIRDLLTTGLVLLVLTSLTVFSFIFTLDYFKSYYVLREKLAGAKA